MLACAGLAVAACALPAENSMPQAKPNVVVFLVDDLGWKDVGFMGSTFYETPHIDALAHKGMKFTQAYASHPVCSPSRAAFMTGKDPARLQITDWIPGFKAKDPKLKTPEIELQLSLDETTIAEVFQAADYKTLFTGKWHLGETEEYWPEFHGFDVNIGGHNRGAPPGGYFSPYKNPRLSDGPKGEFLTERLGEETAEFIEQNAAESFFVYHSFYSVHTPIQADPKRLDYYKAKAEKIGAELELGREGRYESISNLKQNNPQYATMVSAVDDVVGKIVQVLEEQGILDNTIIVFASDNGGLSTGQASKKNRPTSNEPLKAGKGWLYEGGIRTPLFVFAPHANSSGKSSDAVIRSVDIMPTLMGLAGITRPDLEFDGSDFSELLKGGDQPAAIPYVWHFPHYHAAGWRPGSAIRDGNWKLILHYETGEVELFDLENDPYEMRNVAKENGAEVQRLKTLHKAWQIKMDAKLPS